ncbi:hypothetical protein M569_00793, partial [Genlisea aurea]
SSSSSSSLSSPSSSGDDSVCAQKIETEVDMVKSCIRETLLQKSKKQGRELSKTDIADDAKDVKKRKMANEQVKFGGELMKTGKNGTSTSRDSVKNGPFFKDLGGLSGVIDELNMEVIVPLCNLQLLGHLGVKPLSGILLHGQPGCGKTTLAHAIANESGVPFYNISATELVSGVSGASEENIRKLFTKAYKTAPSIVFIDEIDAIASKRDSMNRDMERRIVTQLMLCMDGEHKFLKSSDESSSNNGSGYVLVIGATNRPDAIDPALRRPGRFEREIVLGVPDESERIEILSVLISNLKVEGDFDLQKIGRSTPNFVGADLAALVNQAGNLALKRIFYQRKLELKTQDSDEDWRKKPWLPEEFENISITMADFEATAKLVQPSSRREGLSTLPNVKWDDVGGLDSLRKEFDLYIIRRIKYPEDYGDFGACLETGFLLYGPPGCGKTLIAKAVASEAGASFIHVKGPELLNKYVGESELAVRTLFHRARTCSPCILFFDEIDAITTKRNNEDAHVVERLMTQLLIELDGGEQRNGVYVIGATNRPEAMDEAMLRPGRLGRLLYVPLPSPEGRGMILKALSRKKQIDPDVDLMAIGKDAACENFSGADLSALMSEGFVCGLEEEWESSRHGGKWNIKERHLKKALAKIKASVSEE